MIMKKCQGSLYRLYIAGHKTFLITSFKKKKKLARMSQFVVRPNLELKWRCEIT